MIYDDERGDMLFKLFTRFCLVIGFILIVGMTFLIWMTLKK